MKRMMRRMMVVWAVTSSFLATGQVKVDEQRMEQDIEVAENILSTLARQQFGKRNFFQIEVQGSYLSGYGVTFQFPQGSAFNMLMMRNGEAPNILTEDIRGGTYSSSGGSYSYVFSSTPEPPDAEEDIAREEAQQAKERAVIAGKAKTLRSKSKASKINTDSLNHSMELRFLDIARNFLADYGDVISQLRPEERIIITNRSEEFGGDFGFMWPGRSSARQSIMSAEAKRENIIQLKQGKITRDEFMKRLVVVNSVPSDNLDPDLEVLSSMFNRLYRQDLSKTYYTEGDVSYERLKDYGVIYYMKVYSSNQEDNERWSLPTVGMNSVSTPERDKQVTDLYPKFEADLKENLVEYGRTLRSLKEDEQIVLNVKLTKCTGCGIPASIEVSVKNAVLKEYSSGKTTKESALSKVNVKKVGSQ